MGATFNRVKNWISEKFLAADINAEFNNLFDNLTPTGIDDHSSNLTQMQTTTDPGELGTESLATSLAGEIERLRFVIKEISGKGQWYETPASSIEELISSVAGGLPDNRIASGRTRTNTSQPLFLTPEGTGQVCNLLGNTVNFIYSVEGASFTIASDIQITNLSLAPSANNTALINDVAVADQAFTKYVGEYNSTLTMDTVGTEISSRVGQLVAFKVNNGITDEFFTARIKSATEIDNARRGLFFDDLDAPVPRLIIANNDTITLLQLAFIFATTSNTIVFTTITPIVAGTEPTSPSIGQYWFDTANQKWKLANASSIFVDADATLIGITVQDDTDCIAARSFDFFKSFDDRNSVELDDDPTTTVVTSERGAVISVYGTDVNTFPDDLVWDIALDLDSGVSENADTTYFLYIKENGDEVISDIAPHDRRSDLRGLYHTHQPWRCIGQIFNDESSDLQALIDYQVDSQSNYVITSKVASSALTVRLHASPLLKFELNNQDQLSKASKDSVSCLFEQTLVVSSGSTLGMADATESFKYLYGVRDSDHLFLAVSLRLFEEGKVSATTVAEGGAGAADTNSVIYSEKALTTPAQIRLALLTSTQATAGTWATNPTIEKSPFSPVAVRLEVTSTDGETLVRNQFNTVTYETKVSDAYNIYSTTTGGIVVPWSGNYTVYASARAVNTNGGTASIMRVSASAGTFYGSSAVEVDVIGSNGAMAVFSMTFFLNAGDSLAFNYHYTDSGTNRPLSSTADENTATLTWVGF